METNIDLSVYSDIPGIWNAGDILVSLLLSYLYGDEVQRILSSAL